MSSWEHVADAYHQSFGRLCAGTIPAVLDAVINSIDGTGTLLDVGSGTGELLLAARSRGTDAIGVEPDEDMRRLAEITVPGLTRPGALPQLDLPDGSFSAVTANFVVNHLPDPRAAVRELLRVTAPHGRLAMTIWPAGGPGWGTLVADVFAAAQVTPPPSTRLPAELDFARTERGLADLARDAGADVLDAREIQWEWTIAPEDLWAGIAGGVATPGKTYLAQSDAVQERVMKEFDRRTAQAAKKSGTLTFVNRAVLVIASHDDAT